MKSDQDILAEFGEGIIKSVYDNGYIFKIEPINKNI